MDRVGHLFGHLGPLRPGFPNLPESCLSEEFRQGQPIAVGVAYSVAWEACNPRPPTQPPNGSGKELCS